MKHLILQIVLCKVNKVEDKNGRAYCIYFNYKKKQCNFLSISFISKQDT